MPQIKRHLEWCLKDMKRLKKSKPDIDLARRHIAKSEYNYKVMQTLERLKIYDWALNAGFYSMYHCFLAILAKYGYESRNQSCTITLLLSLIEQKKLILDRNLIMKFDTLDAESDITNPTLREKREISTYGVETSINVNQLKDIKELIIIIQRETIRMIEE